MLIELSQIVCSNIHRAISLPHSAVFDKAPLYRVICCVDCLPQINHFAIGDMLEFVGTGFFQVSYMSRVEGIEGQSHFSSQDVYQVLIEMTLCSNTPNNTGYLAPVFIRSKWLPDPYRIPFCQNGIYFFNDLCFHLYS